MDEAISRLNDVKNGKYDSPITKLRAKLQALQELDSKASNELHSIVLRDLNDEENQHILEDERQQHTSHIASLETQIKEIKCKLQVSEAKNVSLAEQYERSIATKDQEIRNAVINNTSHTNNDANNEELMKKIRRLEASVTQLKLIADTNNEMGNLHITVSIFTVH